MSAQITIGQQVKVGCKRYAVEWVGKEVKLVDKQGEVLWRHSRTVARLLEEQAQKPARKRRGGGGATLTELAADAAQAVPVAAGAD